MLKRVRGKHGILSEEALKRVGGKHGILSEEKLGVLFQTKARLLQGMNSLASYEARWFQV